MNKTDIKVLQEIIRNKDNHVPSLSAKLKKSPSMIYSSIKKDIQKTLLNLPLRLLLSHQKQPQDTFRLTK